MWWQVPTFAGASSRARPEPFSGKVGGPRPRCGEEIFVLTMPSTFDDKYEALCLKSPDQLPDLEGDDFVLTWDADDFQRAENTLIKIRRAGDLEGTGRLRGIRAL